MTDPIDVTPAILREIRDLQVDMARQLGELKDSFGRRLDVIEAILVRHDQRFETIETAIGGLSAQVRMLSAGVSASLSARERTAMEVEALGGRVGALEGRVDTLEASEASEA